MSNSEGMHSPVEQFEIKSLVELSLGGYDVSFTNSSLFMLLAIGVSAIFLISAMRRADMVPGRMQGMAEMMYEFVAEMVRSNVGSEGRPYFPFIFTLFVFLLFGNMLGLIPYSYTFTSQIIVTFAMAAFVFVGVTIIALVQARPAFLQLFRSGWRAKSADPLLDCDRSHFIFRASSQPVGSTFRQYVGRTYHVESFRWSGRDDFWRWWAGNGWIIAAVCRADWPNRS